MHAKMSLLSLAIVSGLAVSNTADATGYQQAAAIRQADALIAGPAAASIHRARADRFAASAVVIDGSGAEHVRYKRSYGNLPVIGGDFVVHSRNGVVSRVTSGGLKTTLRPSLTPRFGRDQAIVEAGARFGSKFTGAPTSRLVVYARGTSPVLAHEVVFNGVKADQTPTEMHYFVDANSGRVLDQWDMVHTAVPGPGSGGGCVGGTAATGTGKSLYSGNVVINTSKCGTQYRMVDTTRGGSTTTNMGMLTSGMGSVLTDADNTWGNNLTTQIQTVAVDANYGAAMTWDYFKNVHGRNGIANDGKGATTRVHFGRGFSNAFWSDGCFCMTYGDGDGVRMLPFVALDVAGHEMSHGVTSRTADLIYSGESGGLNEATSDIFGTMTEFYANNASDTPDYVMGEKLYPNNADSSRGGRYMFKPSLDGRSRDCYSSDIGQIDVHFSSGVANHFFYLLAEGAVVPAGFGAGTPANQTPASIVCNGNTALKRIGRAAAEKIWYRALTVYMTSSTNYAGARAATISASTDLYGAASVQTNAVKAAWSAVSVN